MFRSEEMSLVQLYIPLEIAQQTVAELGESGLVEFNDLNPHINSFQRAFVNEIRRLDDMERKLRFLHTNIEKAGIMIKETEMSTAYIRNHTQHEIDELQAKLSDHESRVQQMNESQKSLNKHFLELTELRHVLREAAVFLEEADSRSDMQQNTSQREDVHLLNPQSPTDEAMERGAGGLDRDLGSVSGVIPRARMAIFERILFRALRGNLYMNSAEIAEPIVDPNTDESVTKNVFIIFAHGKELIAKIRKISESLGGTLYAIDAMPEKRREEALTVISKIEDLKHVLDNTHQARKAELSKVADSIDAWAMVIKKEKAVYHALNLFNYDNNRKALIAEGWCPTQNLGSIQYSLRIVTERTGTTIPPILNEMSTTKTPPTYIRLNKFTKAFQAIIDAYGVASYQEVNPGLFTTISFPFLFAVMFGDFGHGILTSLFAGWMVWKEKELARKKWGEIWDMFFGGRYIILLMGLFSVYTGLIYNDMFARPLSVFGHGYQWVSEGHGDVLVGEKHYTYAFGMDPGWMMAENKLLFLNSYKMKMSIVIGVLHMLFGISLTIFNHLHFKRIAYIYAETIPQMLFTLALFGYLAVIILYKWATDWTGLSPPSLLNTLIYMVLSPGNVAKEDELFPGQAPLQGFLVFVAFICVPWMLVAKPYLIYQEQKHSAKGYATLHDAHSEHTSSDPNSDTVPLVGDTTNGTVAHDAAAAAAAPAHTDDHGDFSEIVIHQVIHTIEFTLSSISHTASYLRLWALSLAHAQLAEVLWEMVLGSAFSMSSKLAPIALVIAFYFWFVMTVFILLLMEGLSAFLHALRLHWVEFNSKFYEGGGRAFMPFSFAAVLSDEEGA